MQEDFHFSVVYLLSRCAGLPPVESRTVACASQYTDECTFLGPIARQRGKPYAPVLTYPPGMMGLGPRAQKTCLAPFHFVGSGQKGEVVVPGNDLAKQAALRAAALCGSTTPYRYHALGITLHALADTYAHQGFSAFNDALNEVSDLKLVPTDDPLQADIMGFFLNKFPKAAPRIGHAEAGFCPDIPFLKWKYRLAGQSRWSQGGWPGVQFKKDLVWRDNAVIAAEAAKAVAGVLGKVPGMTAVRDPEELAGYFTADGFRGLNGLKDRAERWKERFFSDPFFDFRGPGDPEGFRYHGKEWLGRAYGFTAQLGGPAILAFKKGYQRTDWWQFQQAAKWVRRQTA